MLLLCLIQKERLNDLTRCKKVHGVVGEYCKLLVIRLGFTLCERKRRERGAVLSSYETRQVWTCWRGSSWPPTVSQSSLRLEWLAYREQCSEVTSHLIDRWIILVQVEDSSFVLEALWKTEELWNVVWLENLQREGVESECCILPFWCIRNTFCRGVSVSTALRDRSHETDLWKCLFISHHESDSPFSFYSQSEVRRYYQGNWPSVWQSTGPSV